MPHDELHDKLLEVLNFAIDKEQEAILFYSELAARSGHKPQVKQLFMQLANEERGHKRRLEAIRDGKPFPLLPTKITDLKLADYASDPTRFDELDYQRGLLLAMKREKAAFRLYSDLADSSSEPEIRTAFLSLAQEEARHKLRFEIEYDDEVLREN